MPIVVACPCGRSYTKPDHKAGTLFRCHMCGRELTIPEESAGKGSARSVPRAIEPPHWDGEAGSMANRRERPRPTLLRLALAWLLISLGLTGVVSGLGMIYIVSISENTANENAKAHARIFGQDQVFLPARKDETWMTYPIGICTVALGLVLTFSGIRWRKLE